MILIPNRILFNLYYKRNTHFAPINDGLVAMDASVAMSRKDVEENIVELWHPSGCFSYAKKCLKIGFITM